MTKLQKLIALAASAALMVSLSSCATPEGATIPQEEVKEFTITLNDGTVVPCVRISEFYGFDCNWDKAVRSSTPKP